MVAVPALARCWRGFFEAIFDYFFFRDAHLGWSDHSLARACPTWQTNIGETDPLAAHILTM